MRDIRDLFLKIIPKQSWMDEASKKGAIEKVDYFLLILRLDMVRIRSHCFLLRQSKKPLSGRQYYPPFVDFPQVFSSELQLGFLLFLRDIWVNI